MTNDNTRIEWTDATWNPTTGCSKVSDGCRFCYAEAVSTRWGHTAKPWTHPHAAENVKLRPERLDQPLRWRKPRKVFVDSMSDLFHELVPDAYIDQVFGIMAAAPQHTFQVLTKRPACMRAYLSDPDAKYRIWEAARPIVERVTGKSMYDVVPVAKPGHGLQWCYPAQWPLPNVWLGTSIEDARVTDRISELVATPAAVRFLSCEPLIGPLDLAPWLSCEHAMETGTGDLDTFRCDICGRVSRYIDDPMGLVYTVDRNGSRFTRREVIAPGHLIDWVIVGGESGPHHRPIDPDWVRTIRDDCTAAGVAFFFKQWGGRTPKAGGRELDGREWDEMPATIAEDAV